MKHQNFCVRKIVNYNKFEQKLLLIICMGVTNGISQGNSLFQRKRHFFLTIHFCHFGYVFLFQLNKMEVHWCVKLIDFYARRLFNCVMYVVSASRLLLWLGSWYDTSVEKICDGVIFFKSLHNLPHTGARMYTHHNTSFA